MSDTKNPISITKAEFRRALVQAEGLSLDELKVRSGAGQSQSYYVRHKGRLLPLKAVLRLAFILAGKTWDKPHSNTAARQLGGNFDIVHMTEATERRRLERQREMTERWERRRQAAFRTRLLEIFEGRCGVTGCSSLDVIDAAHIVGVDSQGEDTISNGLILRADLHRLFDRDLMAIDPASGRVHFAQSCQRDYADLEGRPITLPSTGPSLSAFRARWRRFRARLKTD
jgi:hypothetical protein